MNAINTKVLPTKRKQVALFSSDPQFKREVATRLDALAIYDVRISDTADFLKGPPAETRPGIVILDLANGELLGEPGIVAARALWAAVPLIAISDELTSEKTRILVRMNASDWLHKPLDAKELLNAVTFHDTGNQGTKSRIITFISASGGATPRRSLCRRQSSWRRNPPNARLRPASSTSISRAPIVALISTCSTSSTWPASSASRKGSTSN